MAMASTPTSNAFDGLDVFEGQADDAVEVIPILVAKRADCQCVLYNKCVRNKCVACGKFESADVAKCARCKSNTLSNHQGASRGMT